jgi:hypothetical protein
MSAWIVSKTHIDALVTYAIDHAISPKPNPDEVGKLLWYENRKSLRYRYADADDCWKELSTLNTYRYEPAYVSEVAIVKAVHCYAYQSCEHPGWEKSAAKRLSDVLEQRALKSLGVTYEQLTGRAVNGREGVLKARAYNASAWGLEDENVQRDEVAA